MLKITEAGDFPGDYRQINSAELPSKESNSYGLVLADTFSGQSKASPCRTNTAREVVKVLLSYIIPKVWGSFGVGPQVIRGISQMLGIVCGL